jgi:large subunit ribosomal protein L29
MKENAERARALDAAELAKQLRDSAEQLFRLRFQMGMGQMEGLKKYRSLRRERARMLTVQREREAGLEVRRASKEAAPVEKKAPAAAEAKPAAKVKPAAKKAAAPKAAAKKAATAPKAAAKPKAATKAKATTQAKPASKPKKSSKG